MAISEDLVRAIKERDTVTTVKILGDGLRGFLKYVSCLSHTEVEKLQIDAASREIAEVRPYHYKAQLHAHYARLKEEGSTQREGLIYSLRFAGTLNFVPTEETEALSREPILRLEPTFDQLFQNGRLEKLVFYGYGSRWRGRIVPTPKLFRERLEIDRRALKKVRVETLCDTLLSV